MSFNILDYIDQLTDYGDIEKHPTWILATCPICKGKLKINTTTSKYGAYCCYTNSCHSLHPNPIRNLFYKRTSFNQKSPFHSSTPIKRLVDLVKPININTEPTSFLTKEKFTPPVQVREEGKTFTYFDYEDFQVVRLDRKLSDGSRKKYLYPEYVDKDTEEVVQGTPETFTKLPVYKSQYVQESILFLEGEKCATIGQKLGLASITFPTFVFSDRYLDRFIYKLTSLGVKNVLFLIDNDQVGVNKGVEVCKYFWKYRIPANYFNLTNIFTDYADIPGFDLYDAYKKKLITKENTLTVLEQVLCQI